MSTETIKNGAVTFDLYRFRVRIRFSIWLVSGYAHVFLLLSVVIVPCPPHVMSDYSQTRLAEVQRCYAHHALPVQT